MRYGKTNFAIVFINAEHQFESIVFNYGNVCELLSERVIARGVDRNLFWGGIKF